MGKPSQAKGRRAELELAKIFQAHGYDVKPGEPVGFGAEPDLMGLENVHIEVKRCEVLRLSDWLDQARRDADRFHDGLPTVIHRRNRSPWLVTMELQDWIQLYDERRGNCDKCGKGTDNP